MFCNVNMLIFCADGDWHVVFCMGVGCAVETCNGVHVVGEEVDNIFMVGNCFPTLLPQKTVLILLIKTDGIWIGWTHKIPLHW